MAGMRTSGCPGVCLAVLLLLAGTAFVSAASARPTIKFGWTVPKCGVYESTVATMNQALDFWVNFTNGNGGIDVGGVAHDVELIIYNDAGDPQLVALLYEHMAQVDQVDLFFGPWNYLQPAGIIAEQFEIPLINIGDYAYYETYQAPLGTFGGWVFSAVPNPNSLWTACFSVLASLGAKSNANVLGADTLSEFFPESAIGACAALGISTVSDTIILSPDLSNITEVMDLTAKLPQHDILTAGTLDFPVNAQILNAIKKRNFQPKALHFPIGISVTAFREAAGWEATDVFSPAAWDPSLNYTDPDFGDSITFNSLFNAAAGFLPDTGSVIAVYGAQALRRAIEAAGSLNNSEIIQALRVMNAPTFFGPANFSAEWQQTTALWICLQASADGTVHPVSPSAPNHVTPIYGVPVPAPPGFLPKKPASNAKWIVIGVVLGALVLAGVAAFIYYIFVVRFHVVFISKQELPPTEGEW